MKVKLVKIAEAENPLYPNNILPGFVKEGRFYKHPTEGEPFWVSNYATSTVQEVIGPDTFRTHNSIYRYELTSDVNDEAIKVVETYLERQAL
jgi:hypothetical protein